MKSQTFGPGGESWICTWITKQGRMARRFTQKKKKKWVGGGITAPTPRLRCNIYLHLRPCKPALSLHPLLTSQTSTCTADWHNTGNGGWEVLGRLTLRPSFHSSITVDFSFMTSETGTHRAQFRCGPERRSFGFSADGQNGVSFSVKKASIKIS
ncbi:hypothetical protein FQA47_020345 [Oryzias melastigma]|uniref:Uncharacterized protein n=1 Tax=Oryzias melastigma TaxID=30732 RepID=A0A834CET5_ORYME|nr:hypothetical protein FQA47_020345 [Oryzias melastigma]